MLPILAFRSPFGEVDPDALSPDDLETFLAAKLPRPSLPDAKTSLVKLIEGTTKKEVLWIRQAEIEPRRSVDDVYVITYIDVFPENPDSVTVGHALQALLISSSRMQANYPATSDHLYRNFAIVTHDQILVVALPVGLPKWDN